MSASVSQPSEDKKNLEDLLAGQIEDVVPRWWIDADAGVLLGRC